MTAARLAGTPPSRLLAPLSRGPWHPILGWFLAVRIDN